jgi:serine protease Do
MKRVRMRWSAAVLTLAILFFAGPALRARTPAYRGRVSGQGAPNVERVNGNMPQMFSEPPVATGWLGVAISEVSAQRARLAKLPKPEGVYVTQVEPNSPAAKAGIQARDIIVGYNGRTVEGVLQFSRLVRETPPGRSVSIRIDRGGSQRTLSAQVTSLPRLLAGRMPNVQGMPNLQNMMRNMPSMSMNRPSMRPLLGVRAMDVSGQLGGYFQVPGRRGVLVITVDRGSAAEKAGVKAGDVIYQVEGKDVQTVGQLEQALRSNCSASTVSLGVVRRGMTLVLRASINCSEAAPTGSSA